MDEIKAKVLEILKDLHPEVDDFDPIKDLVHSGLLNSLDIVTLIGELSDAFDIAIPPSEIVYENFDSVDGLVAMVQKLSD